jgi:hypothetical protein
LSERYEKTTPFETILGFDLFGSPIPTFNFEGRDKIGSVMGQCLTLVYLFVLISFTFFKTYRFYSGSNPGISASLTVNGWTKEDKIDLLEEKMMGAFAFSDFYKGHFITDENYVKMVASIITTTGLPEEESAVELGLHICTEEDWDRLYDTHGSNQNQYRKMRDSKSSYCFDLEE